MSVPFIRLVQDEDPGNTQADDQRADNPPSSLRPRFKAISYNATTSANEPIRVSGSNQQPVLTAAGRVLFPVSFNIYCLSLLHGRYYLGVHRKDPLYRIGISWPAISLYNGLGTKEPLIGVLIHRSHLRRKKRPRDEVIIRSGTVNLEAKGRFTVDVPLPDGAGSRRESFQWRPTRGPAIRILGRHSGLKLVRLATDVRSGSGCAASGGGETVAVLAFCRLRRRKSAAFQFLGSGAQRVLGEDWEVAAVMTAIGLWDRHQRT